VAHPIAAAGIVLSPPAIRALALDVAGRTADPGDSIGYVFSSARQFETYILTGLTKTGPRGMTGAQIGSEGVSVVVDGIDLAPEMVESLRVAVAGVL